MTEAGDKPKKSRARAIVEGAARLLLGVGLLLHSVRPRRRAA